jgi:hypothetical protein
MSFCPEYPQNWETTCYLTKPTHIIHVICTVNMVTHAMNMSLGSLAGTTTVQNNTKQVLVHSHTIINILLLGSPRLTILQTLTNTHG